VIDSKEIVSLQDIQSALEEWIYQLNVLENKARLELNAYKEGFEPLSEKELEELNELDEDTFYKRQMEHQPKASITFATEFKEKRPWKPAAPNQPAKKIEVFFNFPNDIDKQTYKEITKHGWEINGQNFKLKFKQDDIFADESRVSKMAFNTVETLHQYKWILKLVNYYNLD
tara:strand:- start:7 stop:522 length:516 start_codon:yes stop_codon:yes gene_type:complete